VDVDEPTARARQAHTTGPEVEPVRIAVAGLGYWGPNLVRNLQELPDAEVACICDVELEAVERVGRRYPGIRQTDRFEDVLADPDVEAVAIATPVGTHYPLAATALRAGKHAFVEKPLAGSSAEAASLVELAERSGVVLMPGHTFLYSPPVNLIGDLIRRGELGDVYFISTSRVNLGIHQPDVSVTWDLGPHDFSILRYWLGELPARAAAVSRSCIIPGIADVAFVNLEFPGGALAHVEMSWLAPSKLRRTAIVGSEKMVVYDDTSNEPVRIFDSGVTPPDPQTFGEYRLTYRSGEIVSPPVDATEPLSLELRDFCHAIRRGTTPRSSVEVGVDVLKIIEAVDRSLAASGAPVPVDAAGAPAERPAAAAAERLPHA
jgi:predicted dehydrogenase